MQQTKKKFNFEFKIFRELKEFQNLFDNEKIEILFEHNWAKHVINLMKEKNSFFMSLYNLSQTKLTKLRRYIEDVFRKNWIQLFVSSANVSILFVFKKNEELRLCVDYKNLNFITIKNRHFLSLIIETLNRLSDFKTFIKLNLKNIYHRIRIRKDDEWKTTFRTRYEHFEYQIMSFELINAFVIF